MAMNKLCPSFTISCPTDFPDDHAEHVMAHRREWLVEKKMPAWSMSVLILVLSTLFLRALPIKSHSIDMAFGQTQFRGWTSGNELQFVAYDVVCARGVSLNYWAVLGNMSQKKILKSLRPTLAKSCVPTLHRNTNYKNYDNLWSAPELNYYRVIARQRDNLICGSSRNFFFHLQLIWYY